MFARFHYSIRPKAIGHTAILENLGGNAAAFPAKLDDLVLKNQPVPVRFNKIKN
jgi:hypothetical protein